MVLLVLPGGSSTSFSTLNKLHHNVITLLCYYAIVLLYWQYLSRSKYKNQKPDTLTKMGWNEKMIGGG